MVASLSTIDWSTWTPTDRATLLFIIEPERILLIEKKRGLGAGKVAYRDVDMVYSNDFGHGAVAGFRLRLSVTLCTNNQTGCREEIP